MNHHADTTVTPGKPGCGGDIVQLFPPRREFEASLSAGGASDTHAPRTLRRERNARRGDQHPARGKRSVWSRAAHDAATVEGSQDRDAGVWVMCAVAFVALAIGFIV